MPNYVTAAWFTDAHVLRLTAPSRWRPTDHGHLENSEMRKVILAWLSRWL